MSLHKDNKRLNTIQKPTYLLCEYMVNPIGIDMLHPRFSWILKHSERGRTQSAYQILVASAIRNLLNDVGDIWDSGKTESDRSVNVEYRGKPLKSGDICHWKVRWWDDNNQVSPFSEIAKFELGLLKEDDWKARWIGGGDLFRSQFIIDGRVKRARAYVCGLGYYELRINGEKVGDHQLDPGWTDYEKLVLYSAYDITNCLTKGENAVGVILGTGRYAQDLVSSSPSIIQPFVQKYENPLPKVILQINLAFHNGKKKTIGTGENWKVSRGPIVDNDIYHGETYDAQLEKEGWDSPEYDDSEWENASTTDPPGGELVSQATFSPIKATRTIQPVSIDVPKPGVYVYDFGQNFAGWVKLTVSGPKSTEVKLKFAEVLYRDGMINQKPMMLAKATDTYILKGEGIEVYEPRFTYHGFRYVEVTGFPGTPNLDTLQGVVVHSAVRSVGGLLCSNPLINNIHKNVLWGQLSNLMSVPTDSCQRAERMGWMGDAQLTVEEAIYNFDMAAFYTKWLRDIKEAQREDKSLSDVVPPYWQLYPADPTWGIACIIVPWYLYLYYDDIRILRDNYKVMKGWVDYLTKKSDRYLMKHYKYGDWCPPSYIRPPDTPGELVCTWSYYQSVVILSRIALVLGKSTEAEKYTKLADKIKEAFNMEFLERDNYIGNSQTSNLLPLCLDMVPEDRKDVVVRRLVQNIEITHDCHVGTGIVGTRYLFDTLTKYGHTELAYKLATQTTYPSWGYMIREGATTLWERWEYLAGTGMNSHNHIMFGSVDAWFYRVLAGINSDPSAPGFKRIILKPHVVRDLTYVSASINTIRGLVSSNWRKEDNSLILTVNLPVNTKGKINVPLLGLKNPIVKEGQEIVFKDGSYIQSVPGITSGKLDDGYIVFDVGSGSYSFWISESS